MALKHPAVVRRVGNRKRSGKAERGGYRLSGFGVFYSLSAILPDFPTAFLSRLLMNALGDLAAKSTAVSFLNPMALRLFVGHG
jgi:hypothetical protein